MLREEWGLSPSLAGARKGTVPVYKDATLEADAIAAVRLDEPRALLDRFVTLVREHRDGGRA